MVCNVSTSHRLLSAAHDKEHALQLIYCIGQRALLPIVLCCGSQVSFEVILIELHG